MTGEAREGPSPVYVRLARLNGTGHFRERIGRTELVIGDELGTTMVQAAPIASQRQV